MGLGWSCQEEVLATWEAQGMAATEQRAQQCFLPVCPLSRAEAGPIEGCHQQDEQARPHSPLGFGHLTLRGQGAGRVGPGE